MRREAPLRREPRHQKWSFSGTGFLFLRAHKSLHPYDVELHQHEWHEFVWCRVPSEPPEPPNQLVVDGKAHSFGDGTLVSIPAFHPHRFQVGGPLRNWLLGVDPSQLQSLVRHSVLAQPLSQLFQGWERLPTVLAVPIHQRPAFQTLFESRVAEGSLHALDALHLLLSLDQLLKPWVPEAPVGSDGLNFGSKAQEALTFLEENFRSPVGVADCAASLGIARSTLSHELRATTGKSFPQWLTEIRLRHAKALLAATDLSILDIGLECGFNDPVWFSRQFRDREGLPPARWRSEHQLPKTHPPMHKSQGR